MPQVEPSRLNREPSPLKRPPTHDTPAADAVDVDDVEDLLATAGDDTHRLWFFRQRAAGEWPYIGQVDAVRARDSGIREYTLARWGGGKFRVRVRGINGVWGQSRTFQLEGEPIVDAPKHDTKLSADAGAGDDRRTRNAPAPSGSPAWIDKILVPIGATIASAVGAWAAKKMLDDPAPDPLVMELLKQARAGATLDPLALQAAIADAEKRGEDRGREYGSLRAQVEAKAAEPPAGGGVIGALERNVPELVKVLNRKFDIDERLATQARIPAASADAPSGEESVSDTPSTDPLIALLLSVPRPARAFLLDAAQADEAPEIYAGLVVQKLDDVTYSRLPELLARPDFVDAFVATYPTFEPVRDWVERLADALRVTVEATNAAADDASAASA